MRIAIFGANSQIASDLVRSWSARGDLALDLFTRRPDALQGVAATVPGLSAHSLSYGQFSTDEDYDAIINFVGVGDPARASGMGPAILGITRQYDDTALAYIDRHPACRYIFLSSGAAYGSEFSEPASRDTKAKIAINDLPPHEYYAVAKLHAEVMHRARVDRAIVDIRVFNTFSRTQDLNARFFITDVVRAIRNDEVLEVGPDTMVRDFIHPMDFSRLVDAVLNAPPCNLPLDCYSKAPVGKAELLKAMQDWFGLRWKFRPTGAGVNATGAKPHYYSVNHRAAEFGYEPQLTSLEALRTEVSAILATPRAAANSQ